MPKKLAELLTIPKYPFLVTLFPILNVFTHNIGLTSLIAILPSIIIALAVTATLYFLLNPLLRNKHKAGILASVMMFLFLTYGNFYTAMDQATISDFDMHKHRYTMLATASIIILVWWVLRKANAGTVVKLGKITNAVAIILLAMPVTTVLLSYWNNSTSTPLKADFIEKNKGEEISNALYPDVYYFILDGYGREDVLKDRLSFDNSPFIAELEKRGFYVAKKSHSNYSQTLLSITSSLNMTYLQEIYNPSEQSLSYFREAFKENAVISIFKKLGYTTINTASGYDFTNTLSTDLTLTPAYALTEFESTVYNNTLLPFLFDNDLILKFTRSTQIDFIRSLLFEQHREKIKFALEEPRNLTLKPGQPVMAFLHVLIAHQPFVFDKDGTPITPDGPFALAMHNSFKNEQQYRETYIKGYTNQVLYGNKELLKTIDAILKRKDRKSVIILQGDHGPWSLPNFGSMGNAEYAERMSILNAIYLPDLNAKSLLYHEISPVNTFKIIFNHYFNAGYTLEKDKFFFSGSETKFIFKDITKVLQTDSLQFTTIK